MHAVRPISWTMPSTLPSSALLSHLLQHRVKARQSVCLVLQSPRQQHYAWVLSRNWHTLVRNIFKQAYARHDFAVLWSKLPMK